MKRTRTNSLRGPSRRPGYTSVEIALSVLVLMAAMGISVRVLGWVATERRAADRRQWALQEVANVMERATAEPFDRLSPAKVRAIAADSEAARRLPDGSWEVAVDDEPDAPAPAKRVSVRLRWKERSGGWDAPARLTAWVFGRRAGS